MNIAVLIATIGVIAVLGAMISPSITSLERQNKEYSTLIKLREVASGVEERYRENAFKIDSAPDGTSLTFGTETFYLPSATDTLDKYYTPIKSSLIPVVSLSSGKTFCLGGNFPHFDTLTDLTYSDAWRDCFLLYTTTQQTAPDGIKYRDLYVVSGGENQQVDFDGTSPGDDLVRVVSGYKVEKELYDETVKKMRIIKGALENYFRVLWYSDSTRDTTVDHFLYRTTAGKIIDDTTYLDNSCLVTGENPTTGECLAALSEIAVDKDGDGNPDTDKLLGVLGLTDNDLKDAWGNPILVDNASAHVRSPETGKESPFTMRIVAKTPWGEKIVMIARQNLEP